MVGGHADMYLAALDELEHALQHAGHGAERPVMALVEAALAVEVAEELVGAVDLVDHDCAIAGGCRRLGRGSFDHVGDSSRQWEADADDWPMASLRAAYVVAVRSCIGHRQ